MHYIPCTTYYISLLYIYIVYTTCHIYGRRNPGLHLAHRPLRSTWPGRHHLRIQRGCQLEGPRYGPRLRGVRATGSACTIADAPCRGSALACPN